MDLNNLTIEQLRAERPDLVEAIANPPPADVLFEYTSGPRKGERTFMTHAGAVKFKDRVRVLPDDQQPKPSGRRQVVEIKGAGERDRAGRS